MHSTCSYYATRTRPWVVATASKSTNRIIILENIISFPSCTSIKALLYTVGNYLLIYDLIASFIIKE